MKIGVIGLGKMGFPMAQNLKKFGYEVAVYDINPEPIKRLSEIGIYPATSPEDIGGRSDYALIMVLPARASYNVIFDDGLARAMKKRMEKEDIKPVIIDGGNADFRDSIEIGEKLKKDFGIDYLDVGFSGGPNGAEKSDLVAFVGGNYEAFKRTSIILKHLCKEIYYLGELGSGHYGKVVDHNTKEYNIMAAISELAALAHKLGYDPKKITKATNSGLSHNRLQEIYLDIPEIEIDTTGCRVDVTQDAAALAIREAERLGIGIPVTLLVHYLRRISRELYETDKISQETKDALVKDIMKHIEMMEREYNETGTVRSMSIQAKLREKFGGHKVYEIKKK